VLSRLIGLTWRYRRRCALVLVLQVILLALGMAGLAFAGMAIDVIRSEIESHTAPPKWPFGIHLPASLHGWPLLEWLVGTIVVLAFLRSILNYFYGSQVGRLVQGEVVVHLRSELYAKMQRMDFRFFDSNASSSIINRVAGDVQSVRLFLDGVIIPSAIMVLSLGVYLSYMLSIHWPLALACLAPMPLIWILSSLFSRIVHPQYLRNRQLFDDLVLWLSECIRGISVVKAFAFEDGAMARFAEKNTAFREQQQGIFRTVSLFTPAIGGITHLSMIILFGYGGWLVMHNQISLGAGLIVFFGLLQQFAGQVTNIGGILNSAQQSLAAAGRVFEIIDAKPGIENTFGAIILDHPHGDIVFDNVSFSYTHAGAPALQEISFTAPAGQCIGLLGATGSGKSTLLSLVPRFYDPLAGCVKVDGCDVRSLQIESLRAVTGMVFQESFLFAASIADNIAFGRSDASRADIERAAQLAAADEFIRSLPEGYDTRLKEGGASLSGGQRQRLALARALLHNPRILLLDDPTAAVDARTEREILEGLERAVVGRTSLIATHRIAALRHAHRVLVLENGRIVQQGRPDDLAKIPGYYRTLAAMQGEEEND
jgi:ATP-binding cassette subfamily B protein